MAQSPGGAAKAPPMSMRKVASASFVGAFLEWYDFNLYAIAAPLVFDQLFFPSGNEAIGTLLAFVTFGVGFVFRPLGGLVFGHYGDRVGRKAMLVVTLLIIGLSTFFVGLLPTYQAIGIWAPILLVALRSIQGFGLGGEFGGAATVVVEHSPWNRRGFWGSLPQAGGPAGFLLGTALIALFSGVLSEEAFLAWGWRVPFLLSILLLVAGMIIRLKLLETPAFEQMKTQRTESKLPLKDLLRRYPKNVAFALVARVAESGAAKVFLVFAIAYFTGRVGLSESVTLTGTAIYNAVAIALTPVFGLMADRIGSKRVFMTGLVLFAVYIFPYFWLVGTGIPAVVWIALALAPFTQHMMGAVEMPFLSELVETEVRYSGLSFIYQFSAIIAGFLPAMFAGLLVLSGGSPWPVAGAMFAIAVLAFVCTHLLDRAVTGEITGGRTERSAEAQSES